MRNIFFRGAITLCNFIKLIETPQRKKQCKHTTLKGRLNNTQRIGQRCSRYDRDPQFQEEPNARRVRIEAQHILCLFNLLSKQIRRYKHREAYTRQ